MNHINNLLPDVTGLLSDPDLGAQKFTVYRAKGKWHMGRLETIRESLSLIGNIQPASPDELAQFPEGDRRRGTIVIRTATELFMTDVAGQTGEATVSDEIEWNHHRYKVLRADMWVDYGFCVAYATRK